MRRAIWFGIFAPSLLLASCGKPAEILVGSFMIEPGSAKQRLECEGAFATVGPGRFEDTTGAKWAWLTANSHWCRKESSSLLTAWVETAAGGEATHKLTFNGGDQPAVFQPLPER